MILFKFVFDIIWHFLDVLGLQFPGYSGNRLASNCGSYNQKYLESIRLRKIASSERSGDISAGLSLKCVCNKCFFFSPPI